MAPGSPVARHPDRPAGPRWGWHCRRAAPTVDGERPDGRFPVGTVSMTIASPLCLMFSFADSIGSPELGHSLSPPSSAQLPVNSGWRIWRRLPGRQREGEEGGEQRGHGAVPPVAEDSTFACGSPFAIRISRPFDSAQGRPERSRGTKANGEKPMANSEQRTANGESQCLWLIELSGFAR